jgi:hypothetical protein
VALYTAKGAKNAKLSIEEFQPHGHRRAAGKISCRDRIYRMDRIIKSRESCYPVKDIMSSYKFAEQAKPTIRIIRF